MSPYDLRGPAFPLFYSALCAAVGVALVLAKRALEGSEAPKLGMIDPCVIAYLRAGANEALRVLVLSMLDRGLLVRVGDSVQAAPGASARARRPIEHELREQLELPTRSRITVSGCGMRAAAAVSDRRFARVRCWLRQLGRR
jgi:hypothetical protein